MADQEPGHGHEALTRSAVHELFRDLAPGGKLLGLNEQEFFTKLNFWQGYADGFPEGDHFKGHVSNRFGKTYLPAWLAPSAQADHAVADPSKSAQWNLGTIKDFIVNNLAEARDAHLWGDKESEWRHLGAAIHCLQDSYSSAHMFRDADHPDDPTAEIKAINTFGWGIADSYAAGSTHDGVFDKVPVTDGRLERATDRASVVAAKSILDVYVHQLEGTKPEVARSALSNAVAPFLQGPNAQVFHHALAYQPGLWGPMATPALDPAYQAQRDAHLRNEVCIVDPSKNAPAAAAHDAPMTVNPAFAEPVQIPAMSNNPGSPAAGHANTGRSSNQQSSQQSDQIFHPTAGVHTQVKSVTGADGQRQYVYGEGGFSGQTAHEHAANPHEGAAWQNRNGADIICPRGTPVYAAFNGVVGANFGILHGHEKDGPDSKYHGNRMSIEGQGNSAYYAHLDRFARGIAPGKQVHAGQLLGYSGVGGGIAHLHIAFERGDTDRMLHNAAGRNDVSRSRPEKGRPTPTRSLNGMER